MICSNCSSNIPEAAKFCPICGSTQSAQNETSPQTIKTETESDFQTAQQPAAPSDYEQQQPFNHSAQNSNPQYDYRRPNQGFQYATLNPRDMTATHDHNDRMRNRYLAALCYFIPFLPLIAEPKSRFVRFHTNQALVLDIFSAIVSVAYLLISAFVSIITMSAGGFYGYLYYDYSAGNRVMGILFFIFCATVLVFKIIAIVRALKGKAVKLPAIGKCTIIHEKTTEEE